MKNIYAFAIVLIAIPALSIAQSSVPRVPLYEVFTSSTCPPCKPANDHLTPIFETGKDSVAIIKYQMSWPGTGDPYFTGAGSGRRSTYGINSVPQMIRNGQSYSYGSFSESVMQSDRSDSAFMKMQVRYLIDSANQSIHIRTRVEALDTFSDGAHRLMIAVVERETDNNVKTNGETAFHDVFKIMLPGSSGQFVIGEILPGDTFLFDSTYVFQGSYRLPNNAGDQINDAIEHSVEEFNDLHVVMFMQSATSSKEIYQAGIGREQATEEEMERPWKEPVEEEEEPAYVNELNSELRIALFPNPASGVVTIVNRSGLNIDRLTLSTITGASIIQRTNLTSNSQLDISALSAGVYLVNAKTEAGSRTVKLLVE